MKVGFYKIVAEFSTSTGFELLRSTYRIVLHPSATDIHVLLHCRQGQNGNNFNQRTIIVLLTNVLMAQLVVKTCLPHATEVAGKWNQSRHVC